MNTNNTKVEWINDSLISYSEIEFNRLNILLSHNRCLPNIYQMQVKLGNTSSVNDLNTRTVIY